MSGDEFMARGLCAQTDPEAFFPAKGGPTRDAKRICQGCDVKPECLAYALSHDERHGVWGGLSERERRKLRRDRNLPSRAQLRDADKRDTARRMHATGSTRAEIARTLHTDFRRVNAYLSDPQTDHPAAS
ncbi:putative Fe-S protein YdhL (DUF1289 family) [Kutzneria kofuensis]|uniref:Transcriptional regulator WhiB n=1 Tax=Kutzneria kofuensis TaxID=103725 RepID=A0A7W9KHC7_9PSEU|nr:putative Fe-S protein YdhL (DUF1289 family) [Kutzneria kofuensis]